MSLVAGMRDSTIVIWEVGQFHRKLKVAPKLSSDALESCWTDLVSDNASRAHRTIGVLVGVPQQAVPLLRSKLMPTPVADRGKIQQWIAELNSESFAVRQSATQQLLKLDEQAQAPLQTALKGTLSLESRRRLEQILDTISNNPPDPGAVRMTRAVTILERIGSPEAQAVLKVLGGGAPGARTTEEAEASLKRLAKCPRWCSTPGGGGGSLSLGRRGQRFGAAAGSTTAPTAGRRSATGTCRRTGTTASASALPEFPSGSRLRKQAGSVPAQ